MGLYFKGRPITEHKMLEKYLGIPVKSQVRGATYSVQLLEPTERLWIWINLETGEAVIAGDEGNGWCIPLITASSGDEAVRKYIKNPPKAMFKNLAEAIEAFRFLNRGSSNPALKRIT
jgi:hypothetical protein